MTMKVLTLNWFFAVLAAAVLAGCASSSGHAPVQDRGAIEKKRAGSASAPAAAAVPKTALHEKDWRPQIYVVQKGDTLYGIAFNHGLDPHEIAELNSIDKPDMIRVGQEIRLFSNSVSGAALPAPGASPIAAMPVIETKPLIESQPLDTLIKSQPKVAKLPYSEQAVAEIEKMQMAPGKPESVVVAKADPKAEHKADSQTDSTGDDEEDMLDWSMPTSGKVIGEFSETLNQKGIELSGKLGQPVVASAAGKVVYSGSGLRGYGKLVIIKHNKTYISAYAHNDQIMVKEGQSVTKGQKIAEMGNSDSDQVKLHFEIRKFGKPVDPAKYLPLIKS